MLHFRGLCTYSTLSTQTPYLANQTHDISLEPKALIWHLAQLSGAEAEALSQFRSTTDVASLHVFSS
jgi:hypothetical protein